MLIMNPGYLKASERNLGLQQIHKPDFFRLANKDDKKKFDELVNNEFIFLHDEIYDQLKELVKSRNPSVVITANDYKPRIEEHLKGTNIDEYGVWVFYPWSRRLVHMLDEEEFIELRTSANKNKITIAERNILATKKVGVIGLSVGQSVSVTLALERGCGELRLADFDTLELNNLNRIRTGVHNLGLLKAYAVAREIAEIDPYFKVVCFTEGITDDNIDSFFLDGGKLDAVIDECDGINIKILCRIKAKELNVPVLMEASDRGTLDVERFDLEPDRPIMHGWLEHLTLDLNVLRHLKTNEEKIPYILPISGLETLSARMQASMIEMRNTLTTWPQLATAVTLGGALTADTCRRIFLGQFTNSGRYFIDLEGLIPDIRPKQPFEPPKAEPISEKQIKELAAKAIKLLPSAGYRPKANEIGDLVNAAIMAPSAANSQPWKWYYDDGYLFLYYNDTGIISFGDFEHIASNIAHGAAIENLALAANSRKITAEVHPFPLTGDPSLVAAIGFSENVDNKDLFKPAELVNYIDKRVTNRDKTTSGNISGDVLQKLENAVKSINGAELIVKTGKEDITALANVIGPVERLKLLNPASHYEFFNKEIRWDESDNEASNTGIRLALLAISQPEEILLKMAKNPEVIRLLKVWKGGQALEYTSRMAVNGASAIGLITIPYFSPEGYVSGGRAVERMWLTATQHNIAIQPLMTPLLFFARLKQGAGKGMPDFIKEELEQLYAQYAAMFPDKRQQHIFLFKLNISEKSVVRSRRMSLADVLV
jgi:hypothetical protein